MSPAAGRCLVTGASGYVGGRLVPLLLAEGYEVRCLVRSALRLRDVPWAGRVDIVEGDVTEPGSLAAAFDGVDVVYYLVHALRRADFEDVDRAAAGNVAAAARAAGVGRIVYLGGPAPTGPGVRVSAHLRSRAEVADIFLGSGVPTVVLRAGVVIGSGAPRRRRSSLSDIRSPSCSGSCAVRRSSSPWPTERCSPPCRTACPATCCAGSGCWSDRRPCCAGTGTCSPAGTQRSRAEACRATTDRQQLRDLVLRLAAENASWGHRRVRREALIDRVGVGDLRLRPVVAGR